ncbi:IS3 family transposase, partial [Thomasclavelia cocleata]|uniref:IS3 family transposase n=4 Tax=Thomasclavelia cocleata TaxID=69824 RepID=UPI001559AF32
ELYNQVKKKSETDPAASVINMLEKLYISKSGYYDYLKRKLCNQKIRKAKLAVRIREIHKESKEIYRAPKITRILQREGHKVSKRFVGKLIKKTILKLIISSHILKQQKTMTFPADYIIFFITPPI